MDCDCQVLMHKMFSNFVLIGGTGLKHGMDQEMDRKTDRDKLQIQGLERNLDQLCHVASKIIFFSAGGEPSSECYYMGKTASDRGLQ